MRLTRILIPTAAVIMVVSAGCGVDTSSDATTSSGVSLPAPNGAKGFEAYYRELIAAGTKPSVARCYQHGLERLPPAKLRENSAASLTEAERKDVIAINAKLEAECVPAGGGYQANPTDAQADEARQKLKAGFLTALESKGASDAEIGCIDDRVDELSKSKLYELANNENGAGRSIAETMLHECEGVE
ncbi:MAG TPA: hypothetical protein VF245_11345 [Solirubrobacterales bacterium]